MFKKLGLLLLMPSLITAVCSNLEFIQITAPTILSTNPVTVCAGQSLTVFFTSNPGTTVIASGPNFTSQTVTSPFTIPNPATGAYTLVATAQGCSSPASTLNVTVNPEPQAVLEASSQLLCSGQQLTFTATITSGTPPYLVGLFDNNIAVGTLQMNVTSPVIFTVTPSLGTHNYKVEVLDNAPSVCSTTSNVVLVAVVSQLATPSLESDVTSTCSSVTLSGIADADVVIDIFNNGSVTPLASTTSDSSGNFAVTLASLAVGNYTFTAQARVNDSSRCPSDLSTLVDVVVTEVSIVINMPSALLIDTNTTVVSGTISCLRSLRAPFNLVTVFVNGIGVATVTPDANGNFSVPVTLPFGTSTLVAQTTQGNTIVRSNELLLTVIKSTPTPTLTPKPTDALTIALSGPACRTVTRHRPRICGKATPGSTVYVYANRKLVAKTKASNAGTFCITPCRALRRGCNAVIAQAVNNTGTATRSNGVRLFVQTHKR
ncbi:hypothetical protein H0X48_04380 [Candidatus Dependentiae bacterium]|nr:hypothetical protein [Candidatus Dependentiae bacterium]